MRIYNVVIMFLILTFTRHTFLQIKLGWASVECDQSQLERWCITAKDRNAIRNKRLDTDLSYGDKRRRFEIALMSTWGCWSIEEKDDVKREWCRPMNLSLSCIDVNKISLLCVSNFSQVHMTAASKEPSVSFSLSKSSTGEWCCCFLVWWQARRKAEYAFHSCNQKPTMLDFTFNDKKSRVCLKV